MRAPNLLLIEDDQEVAKNLVKGLHDSGYRVEHVADGKAGLQRAKEGKYQAMIIDRMLPNLDGLSIIAELRKTGHATPVLILSALDQVDDRVMGLKAGGDDYLPKPFAFTELLARLEALIRRRSNDAPATTLRLADLEMDLIARVVKRSGKELDLQPREFRLLEYLVRHAGQVVTRMMLLENVWDIHFDPQTNVIDVHISRLRQKLDKGFTPALLHTIRGAGYTVKADGLV